MKYMTGFGRRGCFDLKPAHCALVLVSVAAAGCSADITRFDSASFSLNDPPQTTASVERTSTDVHNPVTRSQRPGPYGAGLSRSSGVDSAPLPDATPAPSLSQSAASPSPAMAAAPPSAPARAKPLYRPSQPAQDRPIQTANVASPASMPEIAKGELIEVQPGDTLFRLSRKHQVSLNELMSVNGLNSPNLKPGQKLYLPATSNVRQAAASPAAAPAMLASPSVTAPPSAPAAPAAAAAAASPEALAKYNATYTVQPGDSLYGIARKHKVTFSELQQVNGITNPLKVRPGVVLKVPGGAGVATAAATPSTAIPGATSAPVTATPSAASAPAASEPTPYAAAPTGPSSSTVPTVLNAAKPTETAVPVPPTSDANAGKGDKVALATPPAKPAAASDTIKLRWPAQGKIIAGFGGRPDGTHNDGINLSVPQGTEVHAAESGVVAYSGSELKGYGNLVLVRHDNGWVTAYAHNDELLVKRGDKVTRGQVIAKAGKTGTVDQPQVHFELRQGSKPVDPTPYMEKL